MSYEIIYDRRFVRTPLGITPMVLAGSNNCYEPMPGGRERRERNWSPLFNEAALSEEALMARVQDCCGGQFQEHFKWRGKFVNDAGFAAFVRNGIKAALTLEELREYAHSGSLNCALSIWYRDRNGANSRELARPVSTTDELVRWIGEARIRVANRTDNEEIYYDMRFPGREPIRLENHRSISGEVVAVRGKFYVSNCEPGKPETTMDASKAMIFSGMDEARYMIDSYFLKGMRFMKAESVKARQDWRFCIRVKGGSRDGMFIERLTRSRVYMCCNTRDARKFPTAEAAERYIRMKLGRRFNIPGYSVYDYIRQQ